MSEAARRRRGFTLIEIMIALMIFALLSTVGYRGLDAVLKAKARVDEENGKWRDLGFAFINIQQSLAAVVDRPVREASGSIAGAFVGVATVRNDEEAPLVFTRMGFADQRGVLADLQRVGYRVRGDRLEQLVWPALDQAPGSEPHAVQLMGGIAVMKLRYLAQDGSWQSSWPLAGAADRAPAAAPAAVELSLRLSGGEQLTRLFVVQ